jgi:adenosylcobinamide-GDP ribazoletransferase
VSLRPAGFWSAVQFLTRVPVVVADYRLDAALVWFPTVGVLLGGALAALHAGLHALSVPPLLTSTLLVVALLSLSGALHADGLMDTADAVFGHATPEHRLEIMRDPRVGSFGVVALVSVVALKIAALATLPPLFQPWSLVLAPMLGRWAIVLLAVAFPYGRAAGLGAPLKAGATPRRLVLASVVPLALCAAAWPLGAMAGAIAIATASLLGWWLMRQLPGLTGDCYGATCEIVETVVLVTAVPLAYALG